MNFLQGEWFRLCPTTDGEVFGGPVVATGSATCLPKAPHGRTYVSWKTIVSRSRNIDKAWYIHIYVCHSRVLIDSGLSSFQLKFNYHSTSSMRLLGPTNCDIPLITSIVGADLGPSRSTNFRGKMAFLLLDPLYYQLSRTLVFWLLTLKFYLFHLSNRLSCWGTLDRQRATGFIGRGRRATRK